MSSPAWTNYVRDFDPDDLRVRKGRGPGGCETNESFTSHNIDKKGHPRDCVKLFILNYVTINYKEILGDTRY